MLSKKTKYALKALGYLAAKYGEGPVLISDIAKKKKIPIKFLETILLELKQAKVLDSKKGKGGGYYLIQSPKKTSLATAIRLVGGPIALLPCVSLNFYEKCEDCDEKSCGLNKAMQITRDATLKILEKKTLAELIDSN
ncbi:Rrf2 family transcriptional regulator [Ferruginibacter lapsinanis]|uniref:RrF2 family transcriptional regulator n=1 Tax=Ferruginibacter lapsinanis TaxID=563172 RepID=UPI001E3D4975|nr:Rrf2 family transcriptional regulator [Ferruginibacter lapsinanis]UEG50158.1 Rrf2 family transcriptional regulator [Ferruginibacter lapsinanis]